MIAIFATCLQLSNAGSGLPSSVNTFSKEWHNIAAVSLSPSDVVPSAPLRSHSVLNCLKAGHICIKSLWNVLKAVNQVSLVSSFVIPDAFNHYVSCFLVVVERLWTIALSIFLPQLIPSFEKS